MPETTGVVTDLIKKRDGAVFGIKVAGEEYLYSFPEYRGEPFDEEDVYEGRFVRLEYNDQEKAGKVKHYVSVLEVQHETVPESPRTPPVAREWGYEHRDRLMARESCCKAATAIFAASITAGIYKTHPDVSAVTDFAGALEKWVLEAIE